MLVFMGTPGAVDTQKNCPQGIFVEYGFEYICRSDHLNVESTFTSGVQTQFQRQHVTKARGSIYEKITPT